MRAMRPAEENSRSKPREEGEEVERRRARELARAAEPATTTSPAMREKGWSAGTSVGAVGAAIVWRWRYAGKVGQGGFDPRYRESICARLCVPRAAEPAARRVTSAC